MSSIAIREVENIDREVKRLLKDIEEQIQRIENGLADSSVSLPLSVCLCLFVCCAATTAELAFINMRILYMVLRIGHATG